MIHVCCQEYPVQPSLTDLFSRTIALGYYDGITSGVVECSKCGACYRLELLEWHEGSHLEPYTKVLTLATLPLGSIEKVIEACPQKRPVSWPLWIPHWFFPDDAARLAAERNFEAILAQAEPPPLVLVYDNDKNQVITARPA